MKILITGGAGFIGSHLVDAFEKRGDNVSIIDNLITGNVDNISQHRDNPRVLFFEADICDAEKIKAIFVEVRPDVVFHLAAEVNVRHAIGDPRHCATVNILGTISILDAMRAASCKRIIFSSTGGVMFSTDTPPYKESDPPSPIDPYGISKLS